jgi:hypothetical protein
MKYIKIETSEVMSALRSVVSKITARHASKSMEIIGKGTVLFV